MVTAAHCTFHASKDNIKVGVGFTDLGVVDSARSFVLAVDKIINHPDYSDDSTINDIAILGISYLLYHYYTMTNACSRWFLWYLLLIFGRFQFLII